MDTDSAMTGTAEHAGVEWRYSASVHIHTYLDAYMMARWFGYLFVSISLSTLQLLGIFLPGSVSQVMWISKLRREACHPALRMT
jgi:hypothetical protein